MRLFSLPTSKELKRETVKDITNILGEYAWSQDKKRAIQRFNAAKLKHYRAMKSSKNKKSFADCIKKLEQARGLL